MKADLRNLCQLSYGMTITQFGYHAPPHHHSSILADPDYWTDAVRIAHPGDWLFVTHRLPDGAVYNAIYVFTSGPLGIWAQQLISSVPPLGHHGGPGQ